MIFFSQDIHKRHFMAPWLTLTGVVLSIFCKFIFWSISIICHFNVIHGWDSWKPHMCYGYTIWMHCRVYIDGLMQERHKSSALAMELHLSCTNPSIYIIHVEMWWCLILLLLPIQLQENTWIAVTIPLFVCLISYISAHIQTNHSMQWLHTWQNNSFWNYHGMIWHPVHKQLSHISSQIGCLIGSELGILGLLWTLVPTLITESLGTSMHSLSINSSICTLIFILNYISQFI